MTTTLAVHVGELAAALHDLRRRFRQSARIEVARAIGEALQGLTRAMICGPVRYASTPRTGYSAWDDDPWHDRDENRSHPYGSYGEELAGDQEATSDSLLVPPALVAGLAAARWGFARTRQIAPALLIGLLVVLAACAGGPTVKALLQAWSTANDLLHSHPLPGP